MVLFKNLFFLFFLSFSCFCAAAGTGVQLPNYSVSEVIDSVAFFIKSKNIIEKNCKVVSVEYVNKNKAWLVYFKCNSLVIGEDGFVVRVSDLKIEDVEIYPGL